MTSSQLEKRAGWIQSKEEEIWRQLHDLIRKVMRQGGPTDDSTGHLTAQAYHLDRLRSALKTLPS